MFNTHPFSASDLTQAAATPLTGNSAFSPDSFSSRLMDPLAGDRLRSAAAASMPAPPPSFSSAPDLRVGTSPRSVAIGDFNGDGKPDLVTGNASSEDVSVLLGQGNGRFSAATNFGVGSTPRSVVVGDFNGDGKADLATVNYRPGSGTLSVLLGQGNGSFDPAVTVSSGDRPLSLAAGDFNADGKADLAITYERMGRVEVLLSQGNGRFDWTGFSISSPSSSVAIGDFNDDGQADLVTADYDSKAVSVLLGQGNGSFDQAVRFGVGNPPGSVAIGDFNGDGKSDLVTANDESDDVSVLLGQGNGRFDQAVHFGVGNSPNSVAIGDFNLDGKPDLVTTNGGSNDISLLVGQGNGSFGPAINFGGSSLPPFFPGLNSAAVGDFNLDGKPDLVTLYSMPNVVSVYLNTTQTNQPPIAQDDTVSAAQNTALHIPVATLLANDLGTDLLSITGLSSVINGVVGLSDSGTPSNTSDDSISFTPAPGFSGNASFNYSISDGMGGTSTATVTVVVGTVQNGGNGKDTLTGNEGNDVLDGGNGKDTLMGNGGNDTLRGRNGDDVLDGGLGHDTVIGGNGRDIFVLSAGAGIDTLVDFKEGTDLIGLSGGLSFSSLTFSGNTILNGTEVLAALTGVNTTTLTSSNFITV